MNSNADPRQAACAMLLVAALSGPAAALACGSDAARAILDEFFVATGGENWLVNDGWLDPELSPCDRFGVIEAFGGFSGTRIVLPENNLDGFIPESVMDLGLDPFEHWAGPGLELCWNELELPPPGSELFEFLQSRHAGGDLVACNARERFALNPGFSGSWYKPARSGEGTSQVITDSGLFLGYWFTYGQTADDPQHWLMVIADPGPESVRGVEVYRPQNGRFGEGRLEAGAPERWSGGMLHLDRVGEETQHFWYQTTRQSGFGQTAGKGVSRPELSPVPPPNLSQRFDQVQLARLAGSTCDNRQPHEWISGAWYDPERDGEGFMVEVIEDGRAVVYWFTYQPDDTGRQAWLMGAGEAEHIPGVPGIIGPPKQVLARIRIDHLVQPAGAFFGPLFDPDDVDRVFWGALEMEFHLDGTAHVSWDSVFEDYGSGDYPLTRLARPKLAECPDD